MQLITKFNRRFVQLALYAGTAIRFLLNILLVVITIALAVGVYKTGFDLVTSLNRPLNDLFQTILVDIVFIIAVVEIGITVQGYLKDGHVHVRYIVDTILIIMLKEIVVLWFEKPTFEETASISLIIVVLVVTRLMVTRFAPLERPAAS